MKTALNLYQYVAPAVLAPVSFLLWQREYAGDLKLTAAAWLVPMLWAYIVPGIGTNVLKMWEFDTRLRLGRFRPHHGFVFGSATAMIAWVVHAGPAQDVYDVVREGLVLASLLGFVNLLYDIEALKAGILIVYNEPWARGESAEAIAMDYAPWFFGGFGAVYGAGLAAMERLHADGALSLSVFLGAFTLVLSLAIVLPTAGYVLQSRHRYGHWGTRPIAKRCRNV